MDLLQTQTKEEESLLKSIYSIKNTSTGAGRSPLRGVLRCNDPPPLLQIHSPVCARDGHTGVKCFLVFRKCRVFCMFPFDAKSRHCNVNKCMLLCFYTAIWCVQMAANSPRSAVAILKQDKESMASCFVPCKNSTLQHQIARHFCKNRKIYNFSHNFSFIVNCTCKPVFVWPAVSPLFFSFNCPKFCLQ